MRLDELENLTRPNYLVHQLFCLKRCFGPQAKIGIVTEASNSKQYGTIAEMAADGHCSHELLGLDPYFANIPPVHQVPREEGYEILPALFNDGGPQSPWEESRRLQMEAATRCAMKRFLRRTDPSYCSN